MTFNNLSKPFSVIFSSLNHHTSIHILLLVLEKKVMFLMFFLILLSVIDVNEMIGTDIEPDYNSSMHIRSNADNSHVLAINCILQTATNSMQARCSFTSQCNVMTLIFISSEIAIAMAIAQFASMFRFRCNRIMIAHGSQAYTHICKLPPMVCRSKFLFQCSDFVCRDCDWPISV